MLTPELQRTFHITSAAEQSNLFGIQGAPNSGKTHAALSFPNPIVFDFDKKLPPGIPCVPFWKPEFIDTLAKRRHPALPNRRDALIKYLNEMAPKLPTNFTIIIDSWTRVQDAFDQTAHLAPIEYMTKGNDPSVDGFKIFRHKMDWSTQVIMALMSLPHTVVITFHEQVDRDEDGMPNGKTKPLMTGQFADKLAGYCSTMVRQDCTRDPKTGVPKWSWQVGQDRKFNPVVHPGYKFPVDMIHLDITNGAYEAFQRYRYEQRVSPATV